MRKALAYQVQHSTAEQLQRSLMPRSLPDLPGLDLGSYYRPGGLNADVGGGWYDVIDPPRGHTAGALGGGMGKGTKARDRVGGNRAPPPPDPLPAPPPPA